MSTILITGASKGIGRSCADLLHARGYEVIGLARNPANDDFPGEFHCVDLVDRKALDETLKAICSNKTIFGLVNNAGLVGAQSLNDIDLETMDEVFQVNLGAATQCAQHCSVAMQQQGCGSIVNISSELVLGLPNRTAYTSSKAALISATRTWALELSGSNVTVNAIAPGPVNTEFFNRNNPPGSSERKRKLERIPLGRFAEPDDVAKTVAFFMSGDARYITGQTLFVDGGSSLASSALF
ncbi:MAG: 3-oxoacyl-[acyl-carrier protein] reductase [Gammaproteobacteria bacterium]|jgi:3-oxoacyl-[acyl-carrier protein] reductase